MSGKKQIHSNKGRSGSKKWAIPLAIFGILGICAAVALPLAMCNKSSPDNTKVYTTDVTNKALDETVTSSDLTTRLNGNIINDVTYVIKTGGNILKKILLTLVKLNEKMIIIQSRIHL